MYFIFFVHRYKTSLELQKKEKVGSEYDNVAKKSTTVSKCNELILDVSDALLRNRAFISSNEGSFFNFDPTDFNIKVKEDVFTTYLHQAFIGYAVKFLKEVGLTKFSRLLLN